MKSLDTNLLTFALWTAGANWCRWAADFEHKGDCAELPVLAHNERYRAFVSEYSLLRYYTLDEREQLRQKLYRSNAFKNALKPADGNGIDELAIQLTEEYPGFDTERSFISKLAAFARPDTFVAWDRFARIGLSAVTNGPAKGNYRSYSEYLSAANGLQSAELGRKIDKYLDRSSLPTDNRNAFRRRVLDVFLMVRGGRWQHQLRRF